MLRPCGRNDLPLARSSASPPVPRLHFAADKVNIIFPLAINILGGKGARPPINGGYETKGFDDHRGLALRALRR